MTLDLLQSGIGLTRDRFKLGNVAETTLRFYYASVAVTEGLTPVVDETPKPGFFKGLLNKTQPIVRAYQALREGKIEKAQKLLWHARKVDEHLLLGVLDIMSGDFSSAHSKFELAFSERSQIGACFLKYHIPLTIRFKFSDVVEEELLPNERGFIVAYAALCEHTKKYQVAADHLKRYLYQNPSDTSFALFAARYINQYADNIKDADRAILAVTDGAKAGDEVQQQLLFARAYAYYRINLNYPAMETLNLIESSLVTRTEDFDDEISYLRCLIFERQGQRSLSDKLLKDLHRRNKNYKDVSARLGISSIL